jgi:hypothetical protein
LQATSGSSYFAVGHCLSTNEASGNVFFPVAMRVQPSALEQSGTAADYRIAHSGTNTNCNSVPIIVGDMNVDGAVIQFAVASGLTVGRGCQLRAVNSSAYLAWSAEL